jgi:F0F1-type ATP synthase assembly protein I
MPGPEPDGRHGRKADSSDLATGYRKAMPILAASTRLVVATGVFTAIGWWLDGKLGHGVPWLTIVGAVSGTVGGLVSFLRTALGKSDK